MRKVKMASERPSMVKVFARDERGQGLAFAAVTMVMVVLSVATVCPML